LHRQEPSLYLSQLLSLGFTLDQALACIRSLPPETVSASVPPQRQSQQLAFPSSGVDPNLQLALAALTGGGTGTTSSGPESLQVLLQQLTNHLGTHGTASDQSTHRASR
jgi:hypothetical protein